MHVPGIANSTPQESQPVVDEARSHFRRWMGASLAAGTFTGASAAAAELLPEGAPQGFAIGVFVVGLIATGAFGELSLAQASDIRQQQQNQDSVGRFTPPAA